MLRLINSSHHLLENEVWTRVGSGDQDAYGQLYVFYYRRLYNYGRKMTTDIALLENVGRGSEGRLVSRRAGLPLRQAELLHDRPQRTGTRTMESGHGRAGFGPEQD